MIICLDGPSGAGKSHLLARARSDARLAVVPKLTTRPRRDSDNEWEFTFVTSLPEDPSLISWEAVGSTYAVDRRAVNDALAAGSVPIVICTDARVQHELAQDPDFQLWYVYRHQSEKELLKLLHERATPERQILERVQEHRALPLDYLDKISKVTHVLLNIATIQHLENQFQELVNQNFRHLRRS